MRIAVAHDVSNNEPVGGLAAVEASIKLLKWIQAKGLTATHPNFDEVSAALSNQTAFAKLDLPLKSKQFDVRLRGLSLNGQKGAAERSALLPGGYEELDKMRIEARRLVRGIQPPLNPARGSKAWYQQEISKRDQEIQDLVDHKAFLTSAVQDYMSCARRFAMAAGMGREFDRLQFTLLRKFGPIGKVDG